MKTQKTKLTNTISCRVTKDEHEVFTANMKLMMICKSDLLRRIIRLLNKPEGLNYLIKLLDESERQLELLDN